MCCWKNRSAQQHYAHGSSKFAWMHVGADLRSRAVAALVVMGILGGAAEMRRVGVWASRMRGVPPGLQRRALDRLAGGGTRAGSGETPRELSLQVRDDNSGETAQMHFAALVEGGIIQEVDVTWLGHDLSAPVKVAEDLTFLIAAIMKRDASRSKLWLAASTTEQHASANRPLCADCAVSLWGELTSAYEGSLALVVTSADADVRALLDTPPPTQPPVRLPAKQPNRLHDAIRAAADDTLTASVASGVGTVDARAHAGDQLYASSSSSTDHQYQEEEKEKDDEKEKEEEEEEEGEMVESIGDWREQGAGTGRRELKLAIRHQESGRRETFILYLLPLKPPHATSSSSNSTGKKTTCLRPQERRGGEEQVEEEYVVRAVWVRGRARFSVRQVAHLRLFVARLMLRSARSNDVQEARRIDSEAYDLFLERDRGGGGGTRTHMQPLSRSMSGAGMWHLLSSQAAGSRQPPH